MKQQISVIATISLLFFHLSPALALADNGLGDEPLRTAEMQHQVQQQVQQQEETQPQHKLRLEEPMTWEPTTLRRNLQDSTISSANCYTDTSTGTDNRYCTIPNTPRQDTFLVLACPQFDPALQNYADCECTIGVGQLEDAPNTDTCFKCAFCKDNALAYDCRNVAQGSCVGVNCKGECIASTDVDGSLGAESESEDADRSAAVGEGVSFLGFAWMLVATVL
mmetsp:Transcript_9514/g.25867  ORF Transcript_9514/g.25867 Transcript_9514/m.25867 type:complete len:222 (-) Transcript_9514:1308-1973(-)